MTNENNIPRILLIDTGYGDYELDEPLGIETLSAAIRQEFGAKVDLTMVFTLLDPDFECTDSYDVVCISANINTAGRLKAVIDYYMAAPSHPPVLVGGVTPLLAADDMLAHYPRLICMIGEGELSLVQLLGHYLGFAGYPARLADIPNLAYTDPDVDPENVIYTRREMLDLSTVHYIADHKYAAEVLRRGGIVHCETTRGCDWNRCTFCIMKWKFGGALRRNFPMDKVMAELTALSALGAKTVIFTDEEFMSDDYERIGAFVDAVRALKAEGKIYPAMQFQASTSTNYISKIMKHHPELFVSLKEVGFQGFFIGMESLSRTQLARYKKNCTPEDNMKVLKLFAELDLVADLGFILFDPMVTFAELEENYRNICNSELKNSRCRVLKYIHIIPHTDYCDTYLLECGTGKSDPIYLDKKYRFMDERVEKIFREVEKVNLDRAYELQGRLRAQHTAEEGEKAGAELVEIRQNSLEFFGDLLDKYRDTPSAE